MSERLAFVMAFTVMAVFVVGLSIVAAKSGLPPSAAKGSTAAGTPTRRATQGNAPKPGHPGGTGDRKTAEGAGTRPATPSAARNKRLSAALRAALGTNRARLSVGVIDTVTGAEALYQPSERYHAVGIAWADILAVLLYQHQQAHKPISNRDARLAAEMIENGSGTAATRLWRAIGQGAGLAAANQALSLRHTIPGMADAWGLTKTTVADQLQLLTDVATARSALHSAGRDYELGLMSSPVAAQGWGVPAAPGTDTSYAVSDAWQSGARPCVVNSISVIDHGGHDFLVVILSRAWPTRAAGIRAVQAAAVAAAGAMPASS